MIRKVKISAILMMMVLVLSMGLATAGGSNQASGPAGGVANSANDMFADVNDGEYVVIYLPNGIIQIWDTYLDEGDHDGIYGHYILKPIDITKFKGGVNPAIACCADNPDSNVCQISQLCEYVCPSIPLPHCAVCPYIENGVFVSDKGELLIHGGVISGLFIEDIEVEDTFYLVKKYL